MQIIANASMGWCNETAAAARKPSRWSRIACASSCAPGLGDLFDRRDGSTAFQHSNRQVAFTGAKMLA
jgi:hypothetical protein